MDRKKTPPSRTPGESEVKKLELVLKCDVAGTEEAVRSSLEAIRVAGAAIAVIQSGVGHVSRSDILMALTGSRLVIGFNVDITGRLEPEIRQNAVEVRLYDTIYQLTGDVTRIAESLLSRPPEEKITGKAKVIATFKSRRQGIIIGCEVLEGMIAMGSKFRVITAMGPAYAGRVSSLQVERKDVKSARPGQQVGLELKGWNRAKIGDLVECYETVGRPAGKGPWKPHPGVFRIKS